MNVHSERVTTSLRAGKVTSHTGFGNSMRPRICSGQRQILVPVLSEREARSLGCRPYDPDQPCAAGDLRYLEPEALRVGDAVYCKVGPSVFTHEIVGIRRAGNSPEFQIARHDRKRINGWTSIVYGKCIRVEP